MPSANYRGAAVAVLCYGRCAQIVERLDSHQAALITAFISRCTGCRTSVRRQSFFYSTSAALQEFIGLGTSTATVRQQYYKSLLFKLQHRSLHVQQAVQQKAVQQEYSRRESTSVFEDSSAAYKTAAFHQSAFAWRKSARSSTSRHHYCHKCAIQPEWQAAFPPTTSSSRSRNSRRAVQQTA